jgi:hypothetical protein
MNQTLFFFILYILMGVWWSRVLNGIIIKEIDINGLSSAERKLHNILWPLSVLIFIISFLKVIFTDVDK